MTKILLKEHMEDQALDLIKGFLSLLVSSVFSISQASLGGNCLVGGAKMVV